MVRQEPDHPTLGIALLSPLTLHALVLMPIGMLAGDPSEAFDAWVVVSIWVTGVAHLVFAGTCASRVSRLATGQPARSLRSVIEITVLTSCVPFVLLLIPPGLVALTAKALLRPLRAIDKMVERERCELTRAALPRAILRP